MPQKKNPDVAELARGKSGRVIGNLVSLLVMLKGLALTYNRDMQEDKEPVFDTAETIQNTLEIMAEMLGDVKVYPEFCRKAASDPLLLATDLADWLVLKGVPFRQAHHIVGSGVALAEKKGVLITQISLQEWKGICPQIDADALKVFSLERAMAARKMIGAPNPTLVRKEITRWQGILKKRA